MELSKAFDTISQSSLLAKVDAYGFSRTSLKLMENCSCNKQQRISINGSFSDWAEVKTEVPQGSIQNSMFLIMSMTTLYYSTGKDLNRIRRNLEIDFMILH